MSGGEASDSDEEEEKVVIAQQQEKRTSTGQRRGPGRPRKILMETTEDTTANNKGSESELEIKIGGGVGRRQQILSTESESECAVGSKQSGECVGLDGGASTLTSSNNRRKQYNRKQHNLSPSGDSADGELSDDETGAPGSNGDRTPSSSTKKLHKKSPKKYPFSSSKSRKAKDKGEKLTRRNLRLGSSDEGSNHESGDDDDSDEAAMSRGSRQAAKQATNAISKTISKQSKPIKSDSSESESDDDEDAKNLKLRKRELSHSVSSKEQIKQKVHSSEKVKDTSKSHKTSPFKSSSKHVQRSNSVSENSDVMPQLEPQIQSHLPLKNSVSKDESSKSYKKIKFSKDEKKSQKSIKEFFNNKTTVYDNFSSSQEDEGSTKFEQRLEKVSVRLEKVQKHAIEKSYAANKDFLKSFESFQKKDTKDPTKKAESKTYTPLLIASTLHPKKVIKEEMKKEKKREEERHKTDDDVINRKESKGLKRKEREWEDAKEQAEREEKMKKEKVEKRKKEKEERKRLEREERERMEREKENIRIKEQLLEKKKQREEEKEKVKQKEFEKKTPLPVSSPKKVGSNQPETSNKETVNSKKLVSPEVSSHTKHIEKDNIADKEIKTPKKLRKWPPENESPDPKKNFIKKHQEEQEKLHQGTVQATTAAPTPTPGPVAAAKEAGPKDAVVKENSGPAVAKNANEPSENSLWENLGYNSGDDVSRYSDDHLNKQLIVKPSKYL